MMTNNNLENSNDLFSNLISVLGSIETELKLIQSNKTPDFLDFKQTCKVLNLKESMLRKLVMEKSIPVKRIGKSLRFNKKEILDWVNKEK